MLLRREIPQQATRSPAPRLVYPRMPKLDCQAQVLMAVLERQRQRQTVADLYRARERQADTPGAEIDDRRLHLSPRATCPASRPARFDAQRDALLVAALVLTVRRLRRLS